MFWKLTFKERLFRYLQANFKQNLPMKTVKEASQSYFQARKQSEKFNHWSNDRTFFSNLFIYPTPVSALFHVFVPNEVTKAWQRKPFYLLLLLLRHRPSLNFLFVLSASTFSLPSPTSSNERTHFTPRRGELGCRGCFRRVLCRVTEWAIGGYRWRLMAARSLRSSQEVFPSVPTFSECPKHIEERWPSWVHSQETPKRIQYGMMVGTFRCTFIGLSSGVEMIIFVEKNNWWFWDGMCFHLRVGFALCEG